MLDFLHGDVIRGGAEMNFVGLLTLTITVIGWFVVWRTQKAIQREAHDYQRRDQNLGVYQARMEKASQITRTLIEASDAYYQLAALAEVGMELGLDFFKRGPLSIGATQKARLELAIILYDPEFRTLRDLMPEEHRKKVYGHLVDYAKRVQEFSARAQNLELNSPDLEQEIRYIRDESAAIGDDVVAIADEFGDVLAHLDKLLATDGETQEKKPNPVRRFWEWLLRLILRDDYRPPT